MVANQCLRSLQKVEGRVASDQELKLTELLRYYMRDIQAAKVTLFSAFIPDRLIIKIKVVRQVKKFDSVFSPSVYG